VLRATEQAGKIVHVSQVLYHWRIHPQSTAGNQASKMYAYDNGRKAITEHLERCGVDATVHDGPVLGTYHVVYHLRTQPLVSVIIPNKDHPDVLARCVESLAKASYANYELLIVENASTDPRTINVTREACPARCKAACPAEFAPPTTCTASPCIVSASEAVAP